MPILTGKVGPWGPMIYVKVMQTPQRVSARKKAGLDFKPPSVVLGLIDTGASDCALDRHIIASLDPRHRGSMSIHTPSTGAGYIRKDAYDVSLVLGEGQPNPLVMNVLAIEAELASQGFLALIGRDVLDRCVFTYDGPAGTFSLTF